MQKQSIITKQEDQKNRFFSLWKKWKNKTDGHKKLSEEGARRVVDTKQTSVKNLESFLY